MKKSSFYSPCALHLSQRWQVSGSVLGRTVPLHHTSRRRRTAANHAEPPPIARKQGSMQANAVNLECQRYSQCPSQRPQDPHHPAPSHTSKLSPMSLPLIHTYMNPGIPVEVGQSWSWKWTAYLRKKTLGCVHVFACMIERSVFLCARSLQSETQDAAQHNHRSTQVNAHFSVLSHMHVQEETVDTHHF